MSTSRPKVGSHSEASALAKAAWPDELRSRRALRSLPSLATLLPEGQEQQNREPLESFRDLPLCSEILHSKFKEWVSPHQMAQIITKIATNPL